MRKTRKHKTISLNNIIKQRYLIKSIFIIILSLNIFIFIASSVTISPLSTGLYNFTDTNITQEFNWAHLNISGGGKNG